MAKDRAQPRAHVSVPSRGLRYLNVIVENYYESIMGFRPLSGIKVSELIKESLQRVNLVSVPSRGLRYLNKKEFSLKVILILFPSPLGD